MSDTLEHVSPERPARPGLFVFDEPVGYEAAHTFQHRLHARRVADEGGNALMLLEHPAVITLGRFAEPSGVIADEPTLARAGVEVRRVERGGQATYHGPGQLVGYPIWKLAQNGLGVRQFVQMIEEVMLRAGRLMGAALFRRAGLQGVFSDAGKVGAVGVAVRRGVTLHGFALNISPELDHYKWIVPCGLTDTPITSLSALLHREIAMAEALKATVSAFEEVFAVEFVSEKLPAQHR